MEKVLDYPYPEELFDADGYPTDEALSYIRNWGSEKNEEKNELVFGKFFSSSNTSELIEYVKSLWNYGDYAYKEEDGLFELHTLGWSGNESIVYELKNTILWMMKLRAHQVGGHYYFKIDKDSDYDWEVTKVKKD
jgi:hypothetical protein